MYVRVAIDHGFEMVEGVHVDFTLYVASTSGQSLASCDVYVQRSPCWLPAVRARRLGCFGELFERDVVRLVHEPHGQDSDGVLSAMFPLSQLFWFSQNYRGGVDCYVLPFPRPWDPAVFVHYRVLDIQDPRHWFRATDYDFVGVVNRPEWAIPAVPLRFSTPQAPSPPAYGE